MATQNDQNVRRILNRANVRNAKFKENNIDDCLSITQTTPWFNEPFSHIQFVETETKTYLFYVNADFFGLYSLKKTENVSWDNCIDMKTTVFSEPSNVDDGEAYEYAVPNHNAQRVYVVVKQEAENGETNRTLYQYQPTEKKFEDGGGLAFSRPGKGIDIQRGMDLPISCMSCFTLEGKDYVTLGADNRIIFVDADQRLTKTFDVDRKFTVGDIVMTSDYYLYARVSRCTGKALQKQRVTSQIYKFNLLEDEETALKNYINIGYDKKEEYFGLVPYYTKSGEAPNTCMAGIIRRWPWLDLDPYLPFHKYDMRDKQGYHHTLGHPYVFMSVNDEIVYNENQCPIQKWDTLSKARRNNEQIRDNNFSVQTIQTIQNIENVRTEETSWAFASAKLNRTNTLVATLSHDSEKLDSETLTVVDVRSRLSCTVETFPSERIVCYNFHPRENVLAVISVNFPSDLNNVHSILRRYNILSTTIPVPEGTNIDAIKLEKWGEDNKMENTLCLGIEFIDYEMYFKSNLEEEENEDEDSLLRSKYDVAMYTLSFKPKHMEFGIKFVYEETRYKDLVEKQSNNATYITWPSGDLHKEKKVSESERYIPIAKEKRSEMKNEEKSTIRKYIQSVGCRMWNCALRPDGKWIFLRPKKFHWIPLFSCCDILLGQIVFLDFETDARTENMNFVTIDNTVNDNIIITATDQEAFTTTVTYNMNNNSRTAKYTRDYEGLAATNRLIEFRHGDTMSMRAFTNRGGRRVPRWRIFLKATHLIDERQDDKTIFCIQGMDAINMGEARRNNIVNSLDFTADDKHLFVCTTKRVFFVKLLFKNHNIVPRDLYHEEGMLKKCNFQMLSDTRMISLEQNFLYTLVEDEGEDKRKVNYDKINDADLRSGTNFSYRLPARHSRTLFASNGSGTICASDVQSKASDGPVYGLELIYLNQKQRIKAEEYR